MDKKELQEIAKLSDLKKYQESKEYKDIIKSCENKAETLASEILGAYNKGLTEDDRDLKNDFHDRAWKMKEFYETMLWKIKSENKWALALIEEIKGDIEQTEKWLTASPMDAYLNVYSSIRFTDLDMKRAEISFNRNFEWILQWLINLLEKDVKTDDNEVY